MKQEIDGFFKRFEGDLSSLALYAYLCTILNGNERQLISQRQVSLETGLGRSRLAKILANLEKIGVMNHEYRPGNGVLVSRKSTTVCYFQLAECRNQHAVSHFQHSVRQNQHNLTKSQTSISSKRSADDILKSKASCHDLGLRLETKTIPRLETKTKSRTPAKRPRQKAKTLPFHPEDLELGKKWHIYALTEMRWSTAPREWNDEFFATGIAQVKRKAGLTHEQMTKIYEFVKDDDFWSANALSPKTLLKKSSRNDLRKIDNIISSIRAQNPAMKQLEKVVHATEEEKVKADDVLAMLRNPEEYFRKDKQ